MKPVSVLLTFIGVLLAGSLLAQEVTTGQLRVEEIVESGRGVLLPLDGALAPFPEEAALEVEEPLVVEPAIEPDVMPVEADETHGPDAGVETVPEAAQAPEPDVVVSEADQPETPEDLLTPLQTFVVELGDPASIGPYRLWLASYRNKSEAQAGWETLVAANPEVLEDLIPILVLKELGEDSETFFRLQAGPLQSQDEADAACRVLQDADAFCTVLGP